MRCAFFRMAAAALAGAFAFGLAGCSSQQRLMPSTLAGPREKRPAVSCSSYKTFSGGTKVTFDDRSGQKMVPYVYVTDGAHYLSPKNGAFTAWSGTPSLAPAQYEYPLKCYTKTPFGLPSGAGIRVYVSYGPIVVGNASSPGWATLEPECCEKPNEPNGFSNPNYNRLWDYWEYTTSGTGINLDTSQVDAFGLPFSIAVSNPAAGNPSLIGPKSYADVVKAFSPKSQPLWSTLNVKGTWGPFKGKLLRIMSPGEATEVVGNTSSTSSGTTKNSSFPPTFYYDAKVFFKHPGGYLGYVVSYYASATPKKPNYKKIVFVPYQTQYPSFSNGSPACNEYKAGLAAGSTVCPTYYAYYALGAFRFVLATKPSGQSGYPSDVTIPVRALEQIWDCGPNARFQTCGNGIWNPVSVPSPNSIGSSATLAQQVTFYLYKALAVDITRGVVMQRGIHPVMPCSSAHDCQASFSPKTAVYGSYNYYRNPNVTSKLQTLLCGYCLLLHQNFIGGKAYASAYDDYLDQSTDTTSTARSKITVTIEPMTR